jgi:carboxymethylenebutenolidase
MDQRIIDLYDRFTHGTGTRRDFLDRLALLAGGVAAASAVLPLLENNYALADLVPENDARLVAETVGLAAGGATIDGYLVRPAGSGTHPAVVVIHENRGLNPHIRDVARRVALEGFIAFAPDLLSPVGGTPADPDQAREMIGKLQAPDVVGWLRGVTAALRSRPEVDGAGGGKVGAVGFCWGGGMVNALAVAEPRLDAAIAYYGRQPDAAQVPAIQAPLLLHYAGLDERIDAGIPAFEAALKSSGKTYELFVYPGVNHAFNNDTGGARYDKAAAELAWGRSVAFLKRYLG